MSLILSLAPSFLLSFLPLELCEFARSRAILSRLGAAYYPRRFLTFYMHSYIAWLLVCMQILMPIDHRKNHTFLFKVVAQCFCCILYYYENSRPLTDLSCAYEATSKQASLNWFCSCINEICVRYWRLPLARIEVTMFTAKATMYECDKLD